MPEAAVIKQLEINAALVQHQMEASQARLELMERKLGRVEGSISDINLKLARWAPILAALAAGSPFAATLLGQ